MLDCGGRNYEDGSCALFSLSNQRPVIFPPPLKGEDEEQVSWRAGFYLCWRECAARTALYFPWTHFNISSRICPSCELNRNRQILGNVWGGEQRGLLVEKEVGRRWSCWMGDPVRRESRVPDPMPMLGSRGKHAWMPGAPVLPLPHHSTSEEATQLNWTHLAADENLCTKLTCRASATHGQKMGALNSPWDLRYADRTGKSGHPEQAQKQRDVRCLRHYQSSIRNATLPVFTSESTCHLSCTMSIILQGHLCCSIILMPSSHCSVQVTFYSSYSPSTPLGDGNGPSCKW